MAEPSRHGPRPGGDPVGLRRRRARRRAELRELPVELIAPEPRPAAQALRRGRRCRRWPTRCSERGVLQPVLVRPRAGGTLRARRRRAPLARRAARRASRRSRRSSSERDDAAVARGRAHREHGPRGPQPDRGGARRARRSSRSWGSRARRSAAASAAAASRSRTSCACSTCPTRRSSCVEDGALTEGHGRALLLADDHADRRRLARAAVAGRLVGARASSSAPARPTPPARAGHARPRRGRIPTRRPRPRAIAEALGAALGTEVRVRPRGTGYRVELALRGRRRGARPGPPRCAPERSA